MKNKRLVSTVTAIVCSSLVSGVALWKVPPEVMVDVLAKYFLLVGGCIGLYGGLQSYTDTKGVSNGD